MGENATCTLLADALGLARVCIGEAAALLRRLKVLKELQTSLDILDVASLQAALNMATFLSCVIPKATHKIFRSLERFW